ncbi:MAG TPA: Ig domain-containing protein, partial [Acidobacteriaceae bacterium]
MKTIWASIGIAVCFFYLGCGSVQSAEAGVPNISQVVPLTVSAGSNGVTVKITGSNFSDQSVVLWNGGKLATTVVDDTTLASPVESASLSAPGTAQLQVENAITGQKSKSVSVTIFGATTTTTTAPALTISTTSLPSGVIGTPYSFTLVAAGGTPAYSWSVTSGKLPAGLSLSAFTGILSGTPTATGSFSFGVTVKDYSNPVQSKSATVTIVIAPTPLTITTSALSSGSTGKTYSQTLQASGGTPFYRWAISSGSLPAGLTLSSVKGTISGTPTASGIFAFNVTATDKGNPAQTSSAPMTIVVTPSSL